MVRQSRDGWSPLDSTRTRVPRTAPLLASCDVTLMPSMPSRETAFWIDARGAPASTSAPRIMSPLAPEKGSKTAIRDKGAPLRLKPAKSSHVIRSNCNVRLHDEFRFVVSAPAPTRFLAGARDDTSSDRHILRSTLERHGRVARVANQA